MLLYYQHVIDIAAEAEGRGPLLQHQQRQADRLVAVAPARGQDGRPQERRQGPHGRLLQGEREEEHAHQVSLFSCSGSELEASGWLLRCKAPRPNQKLIHCANKVRIPVEVKIQQSHNVRDKSTVELPTWPFDVLV